jgi:NTE family protein
MLERAARLKDLSAMETLADRLRQQPFELILSSGFFGFFAHTGVVSALEELRLRPRLVGGSSAGALVAGLWGAGLSSQTIRDRLFSLERSDFWDPDPLFALRGGFLRGARFQSLLDDALGGKRFEDCPIEIRVVAFDVARLRATSIGRGDLATAIRASCSVPGMFQPTRLDGRSYVDGGVSDRAGITAATRKAKVLYHHLPATSPWRRFTPKQNQPPGDVHLLCEPDLPRLSPFHLHRGPLAYQMARDMALRALTQE